MASHKAKFSKDQNKKPISKIRAALIDRFTEEKVKKVIMTKDGDIYLDLDITDTQWTTVKARLANMDFHIIQDISFT